MTIAGIKYRFQQVSFNVLTRPWLHLNKKVYDLSGKRLATGNIHKYSLVSAPTRGTEYGMTISNEQSYFKWYTSEIYSGQGRIVDLGCWLGSTTIPLVKGLKENTRVPEAKKKVYAYDLFRWEGWMDGLKNECTKHLKEGDDFLPVFRQITEPYKNLIHVEKADLTEFEWDGSPVEFLLVDAMKSKELTERISKSFYQHLIPGKSYVLHQDFAHFYTPWLHLLQYYLKDYFSFAFHVHDTPSVVFKLEKAIPADVLTNAPDFASFPDKFVTEAFHYSLHLVHGHPKNNVAAAHAMYYFHIGQSDKARQVVQKYLKEGFSPYSEMDRVIQLLH